MRIVGVIPERMNSSRFPGKPLAKINGKPMVQHVYENSKGCKLLDKLYVATGDQEILDCVKGFGGKTIVTSDKHFRASNQCAEAMLNLEEQDGKQYDLVVMIQGDEPMVNPSMIEQSVKPLLVDEDVMVTNLMKDIHRKDSDVNEVKVVVDKDNNALYFSRCDIPYNSKVLFKQVCIIGFRREMLRLFPVMVESPLEHYESVDMNRLLENGIGVKMVSTSFETFSVDTPKELKFVEYRMKK